MALNIDADVEKTKWVDHPEIDDVSFCIRPLTNKFSKKARKQCVTIKKTRKGDEEILDEEKFDQVLVSHVVEDWKGIVDSNGNQVKCTFENKEKIFEMLTSLKLWALREANALVIENAEVKEKQEKN